MRDGCTYLIVHSESPVDGAVVGAVVGADFIDVLLSVIGKLQRCLLLSFSLSVAFLFNFFRILKEVLYKFNLLVLSYKNIFSTHLKSHIPIKQDDKLQQTHCTLLSGLSYPVTENRWETEKVSRASDSRCFVQIQIT